MDGSLTGAHPRQSLPGRPGQSPGATEPGHGFVPARTMEFIVLEQGFEGARLNTCTMSDLQTLAANLLANFATVRIPRCESLWISSVPNPSPKHRYRLLSRALAGETLIMNCHRQHLQYRLLEQGHRAFFDRVEGGGPKGWRLHFFCLDPAALSILYDVGVGVCGPGKAATFDAEQFVMHRVLQLERIGRLNTPDGWWDWDS